MREINTSRKYKNGMKFTNNDGEVAIIIGQGVKSNYYWIKFNDEHGAEICVNTGCLNEGRFRNPYFSITFGIGYMGMGKYVSKEGNKHTPQYTKWHNMLNRCYNPKYQERQPAYKGCTVCEKWHNFQVFAKWFDENYVDGYQLDKDLLIEDNKVYSPENCVLIPQYLNSFLPNIKNSNSTGIIGVSLNSRNYTAYISINSKNKYLGTYDTAEEAGKVYDIARAEQAELMKIRAREEGLSERIIECIK